MKKRRLEIKSCSGEAWIFWNIVKNNGLQESCRLKRESYPFLKILCSIDVSGFVSIFFFVYIMECVYWIIDKGNQRLLYGKISPSSSKSYLWLNVEINLNYVGGGIVKWHHPTLIKCSVCPYVFIPLKLPHFHSKMCFIENNWSLKKPYPFSHLSILKQKTRLFIYTRYFSLSKNILFFIHISFIYWCLI